MILQGKQEILLMKMKERMKMRRKEEDSGPFAVVPDRRKERRVGQIVGFFKYFD